MTHKIELKGVVAGIVTGERLIVVGAARRAYIHRGEEE